MQCWRWPSNFPSSKGTLEIQVNRLKAVTFFFLNLIYCNFQLKVTVKLTKKQITPNNDSSKDKPTTLSGIYSFSPAKSDSYYCSWLTSSDRLHMQLYPYACILLLPGGHGAHVRKSSIEMTQTFFDFVTFKDVIAACFYKVHSWRVLFFFH